MAGVPTGKQAAGPFFVVAAAAILGSVAAIHYHRLGLTLSHYDARGHLVVSRRIMDSITPGWQQIGAVWLPLPHLLNALPVQVDAFYRTGASAVAISIASFAVSTAAIAWIVGALTGSGFAGGRWSGGLRAESQRALPAGDTAHRAAAARVDASRRGASGRVVQDAKGR